jgi:hypothetical protein
MGNYETLECFLTNEISPETHLVNPSNYRMLHINSKLQFVFSLLRVREPNCRFITQCILARILFVYLQDTLSLFAQATNSHLIKETVLFAIN